MSDPALQTQIHLLQEQVSSLQQTLEQTRQALEQSRRENTVLRQKLDALARRFFGKKSEQLNAAQLELLLQGLVESAVSEEKEEPPARPAPRTASARRFSPRSFAKFVAVDELVNVIMSGGGVSRWASSSDDISGMTVW